jgi:hypothetical protein
MGACVSQIQAAAGANDTIGVVEARDSNDPNNALVLANRVGDCTRGAPQTELTTAVTGNCETECQ